MIYIVAMDEDRIPLIKDDIISYTKKTVSEFTHHDDGEILKLQYNNALDVGKHTRSSDQ